MKQEEYLNEETKQKLKEFQQKMNQITNNVVSIAISNISKMQEQILNSLPKCIINMQPMFEELGRAIEEARKNPNSKLSWMKYTDKLSEFFWIMPYKMTTEELYDILQNVNTEEEFDRVLYRYFSRKKVLELMNEIYYMLPNKYQKKMFDQIVDSYNKRGYMLANAGLILMIDNLLTFYLINKGCLSRIGIFEAILEEMEEKENDTYLSFILLMLKNNINLLYKDIEFNDRIKIETNKKSRRNPTSHGRYYTNKKIDAIMLMNTIFYLLVVQNKLKKYKNRIYKDKQQKKFVVANEEKKKQIMFDIEKSKKMKRNKELLN